MANTQRFWSRAAALLLLGVILQACASGGLISNVADPRCPTDAVFVAGECRQTCSAQLPCASPLVCSAAQICVTPDEAGTTCSDNAWNGTETDTDCGGLACGKCVDGNACLVGNDCWSGVCVAGICAASSCADSIKNGFETDVDCGGPRCLACASSLKCVVNSDCQSTLCSSEKICRPNSCFDQLRSGTESDTDCGGLCTQCSNGKKCRSDADCVAGYCSASTMQCTAPTCADGVRNGTERDVDCGGKSSGVDCSLCATGASCSAGGTCASQVCSAGACQAPTCSDSTKNGSETDVDCGGGSCNSCALRKGCLANSDCLTGYCGGDQRCYGAACSDGKRNNMETGIDCGGDCPACTSGNSCTVNSDCATEFCDPATGECRVATCTDNYRNGTESDVDCGGDCSQTCAVGALCGANQDCTSGFCNTLTGNCRIPNCGDLFKNGTESDLDCGGGQCQACRDGAACFADSDCASSVCLAGICQMASCSDERKNGLEADVDCGGSACHGCAEQKRCRTGVDCQSGVCGDGSLCAAPRCDDGVKNGNETGLDCGGDCAARCAESQGCTNDDDCLSGFCHPSSRLCREPTCLDGFANGTESDTDCGGGCTSCAPNSVCNQSRDCSSKVCASGVCAAPTCSDGRMNGAETDVDCGGGSCGDCAVGGRCVAAADCASGFCAGDARCRPLTCQDGVKSGTESDVDCGGTCSACALAKQCAYDSDCLTGFCSPSTQRCTAPTCSDQIRNGLEADVDCGGAPCAGCGEGRVCTTGSNCLSGVCTSGLCAASRCDDGVRGGAETDIDCGGSGFSGAAACAPCSNARVCNTDSDCASGWCAPDKQCRPSTCGDGLLSSGETDVDCGGDCAGCALAAACLQNSDCASGYCPGATAQCAVASCTDGIKNGTETDADCGGSCSALCGVEAACRNHQDCWSGFCHPQDSVCALPSCDDSFKNSDETDVDCGGAFCTQCAAASVCTVGEDCQSGRCRLGQCQAASCFDGLKNGTEVDADCGGAACPACATASLCLVAADCASGVCGSEQLCLAPTCADGVRNGSESDVDCGGAVCAKCADASGCRVGADCTSGVCGSAARCMPPACNDGVRNGTETGVDCGGGCTGNRCGNDVACSTSNDCASGFCHPTLQLCKMPTCVDGLRNGDETDVDCGGTACAPCGEGQSCLGALDCSSRVCSQSLCQPSLCSDGVKNGSETDVDCGSTCAPCAELRRCSAASDCASGFCRPLDLTCQVPTCVDGYRNGGETDTDCGGPCDNGCNLAQGCVEAADCVSGVCTSGRCAAGECPARNGTGAEPLFAAMRTTDVAQSATGSCNPGYIPGSIAPTALCQPDGSWTSFAGSCVPRDCGTPPAAPAHASYVDLKTTYSGSIVTAACDPGYNSTLTGGLLCQTTGQWLVTLTGACTAKDCGTPPPPPLHAVYTSAVTTYSGVAIGAVCTSGFSGALTGTIKCGTDGAWSGAVSGTCLGLAGATCTANGDCSTNFVCVPQGSTKVCATASAAGGPCDEVADCTAATGVVCTASQVCGVCVRGTVASGSTYCDCEPHWAGVLCDTCAAAYFGQECLYERSACELHGTVAGTGLLASCTCAAGYAGFTCQATPAAALQIDGVAATADGKAYTNAATVNVVLNMPQATAFKLFASDTAAAALAACEAVTSTTANWIDYPVGVYVYDFASAGATNKTTFYARFKDAAGNLTTCMPLAAALVHDTIAPSAAAMQLAQGAAAFTFDSGATAPSVSIDFSGAAVDVASMCVTEGQTCASCASESAWTNFAATSTLSVTGWTDGVHTVAVLLRDYAGNTSCFTDSIIKDTTAPTAPVLAALPQTFGKITQTPPLNWTLSSDAVGSGIASYQFKVTQGSTVVLDWASYPATQTQPFTLTLSSKSLVSNVAAQVAMRAVDNVGLLSGESVQSWMPYEDNCNPNPCQNGGTCTSLAGGYQCACTDLYGGVNCESVCSGRGTVTNGACVCNSGSSGLRCEIACNNHGTWNAATNSCTCDPGWTGPYCLPRYVQVSTVAAQVSGTTTAAAKSLVVASNPGFAANDFVLIHQTRSAVLGAGIVASAGAYETNKVTSVSNNGNGTFTLALDVALANVYRTELNNTPSNSADDAYVAQVVKMERLSSVSPTIVGGDIYTAPAWNGATGGILALKADNPLVIMGGLSMDGKGYRGKKSVTATGTCYQGEGWSGEGSANNHFANNNGGGCGRLAGSPATPYDSAGGGGHAAHGELGAGIDFDNYWNIKYFGRGGVPAGSADQRLLFFGGAGGTAAVNSASYPRNAGNGGGIIYVDAPAISMGAQASVSAQGEKPVESVAPNNVGGQSGGGAGGAVVLDTDSLASGLAQINASGAKNASNVASGAAGRITIMPVSMSSSAVPSLPAGEQSTPPARALIPRGADSSSAVLQHTFLTDSIRANITSVSGKVLTLQKATAPFAVGDVVFLHQTRAVWSSPTVAAGSYEVRTVSAASATQVTLDAAPRVGYRTEADASYVAQIVRIPQFANVTVQGLGELTATEWDGVTGGILAIRASGKVEISSKVHMDSAGYRGLKVNYDTSGCQGEGWSGVGACSADAGAFWTNQNGGGGGIMYGTPDVPYASAGGGGHASVGVLGSGIDFDNYWNRKYFGRGGLPVGSADQRSLFFGGAGGTAGFRVTVYPRSAGSGGGIVYLESPTVAVLSTGSLSSNGQVPPEEAISDTEVGGQSGGGAGGAIYIKTNQLTGLARVTALGRANVKGQASGASGRITITTFDTTNGTNQPGISSLPAGEVSNPPSWNFLPRLSDNTDVTVAHRFATDAIRAQITNVSGSNVTIQNNSNSGNVNEFKVNDTVLLHQSRVSIYDPVPPAGTYEVRNITAINGMVLTLNTAPKASYRTDGGLNYVAQIIRVPKLGTVTVASTGELTATPWDGTMGGILALRASGAVSVAGKIHMDGAGYRGLKVSYDSSGCQGEGWPGVGGCSADAGAYYLNQNGGGGGIMYGAPAPPYASAGGGGHAGFGERGAATDFDDYWNRKYFGRGGVPVGGVDQRSLFFGGAGGTAGFRVSAYPRSAGSGGGIVYLEAPAVAVLADGSLSSNGEAPLEELISDTEVGGQSGGGAGGAIYIKTNQLTGLARVTALGRANVKNQPSGAPGRITITTFDTSGGTNQASITSLPASEVSNPPSWNLLPRLADNADVTLAHRFTTDAIRAQIASVSSNTVTIKNNANNGNINEFTVGDTVLLHQSRVSIYDPAPPAGTYEVRNITAINGMVLTLNAAPKANYRTDGGLNYVAQIIRMPKLGTVTVTSTGELTATPWDGTMGGIMALRASGALSVAGKMHMDSAGYRGLKVTYDSSGCQGEGWPGVGGCSADGGAYYLNQNGGGGGILYGSPAAPLASAGGGGHASSGALGSGSDYDNYWNRKYFGRGGLAVGGADQRSLFFGGAGGTAGFRVTVYPRSAGNGGGIIYLESPTVAVLASGSLSSNGEVPPEELIADNGVGGHSGGGAGGAIYIKTNQLTGLARVTALGRANVKNEASGAPGRITITTFDTSSGADQPSITNLPASEVSNPSSWNLLPRLADNANVTLAHRFTTDAIRAQITSVSSNTVTIQNNANNGNINEFRVGDTVLLHQSRVSIYDPTPSAGTYEMRTITAINGLVLTLNAAPKVSYRTDGGLNYVAQIIRLPKLGTVTVASTGELTATPWDGTTGGILALRASGAVSVAGKMHMDSAGYRGLKVSYNSSGCQGEGWSGVGGCSADAGAYLLNQNGGGGGILYGAPAAPLASAGGGGHASFGAWGSGSDYDNYWNRKYFGRGGLAVGGADQRSLFFGGAGGTAGFRVTGYPRSAGSGGGIIYVEAPTVAVLADGSLSSNGEVPSEAVVSDTDVGGQSGGGAGGAIYIKTNEVTGLARVTALGRANAKNEASGAPGRITITTFDTSSDTIQPSSTSLPAGEASNPPSLNLLPRLADGADLALAHRFAVDAIRANIASTNGNVITLQNHANPNNTNEFRVGDLLLLHQTRAPASGATIAAGTYELRTISAMSGMQLTLDSAPKAGYRTESNATYVAQVIRVAKLSTLALSSSAELTATEWDGRLGGILPLKLSTSLTVNGLVNMRGKGFRAAKGTTGAVQGEGFSSAGAGDNHAANQTGGGAGRGNTTDGWGSGGGGGHAAVGTNGLGSDGGSRFYGRGGAVAPNTAEQLTLFLGGAGGSAAMTGAAGNYPRSAGNGGGIIFLDAPTITVNTGGAVRADGEQPAETVLNIANAASGGGNSGGGAGGGIYLTTDNLLGSGSIMNGGGLTASGSASGSVGRTTVLSNANPNAPPTVSAALSLVPAASLLSRCSDGVQNGGELAVDCSGGCLNRCTLYQVCSVSSDCQSGSCQAGYCLPGSGCSDNVQNGDETAVDCGGSCGCPSGMPASGSCDCSLPAVRWADCAQIKSATQATLSGVYIIDPDGAGGMAPMAAQCDMSTDSGGWTLVLNYLHKGGTNPALTVRTSSVPLIGSTTLGEDQSLKSAFWGHVSNSMLAKFSNAAELRFYGTTNAHSRIIHFKTSLSNCMSYFKTGAGSCAGVHASFTALSGHTANLPGQANAGGGLGNAGDTAATYFPIYRDGLYHWGINGGGRWEMDDFNGGSAYHTLHQIWVRPLPLLGQVALWLDGSDTNTLFQDAAGTTPVTAQGQNVALWKDKSSNRFHATAGATAPTLLLPATNNIAGLSFNNSPMVAQVNGSSLFGANGNTFTIFVATKVAQSGATLLAIYTAGCTQPLHFQAPWTDGKVYFDSPYCNATGDASLSVALSVLNQNTSYSLIRGPNSAKIFRNGTQQATLALANLANPAAAAAGLDLRVGAAMVGQILEVLVFNSELSTANQQAIEQYLKLKWGLP